MKLANLRWIAPAIISVTLAGPAFAAASLPGQGPARPVASQSAPASTTPAAPSAAPAAASSSDAASYAQREKQSQGLENFRGGATLVIGGSALVLALLIILILVLI